MHAWLFGTDFTDFQIKFWRMLKKTCGRSFWHWLHGLQTKGLKISPGRLFTSSKEKYFLKFIRGISTRTSRTYRKSFCECWKIHLRSPLLALTSRTKGKVQKISQGWLFTSSQEYFFSSNPYVAFWHGLHGLSIKFLRVLRRKKHMVAAFDIDFTDLRQKC